MKYRCFAVVVAVCLGFGSGYDAQTETPAEATMTQTASGSFEVELSPQAPDPEGSPVGRMLIDKRFHGDLEGVSQGQMLAFRSTVEGSAGYVAVEEVKGTLHGRSGTFVLQHSGTMTRGEPGLSVTVVPDSGTDELEGLSGTMSIDIRDGGHFYTFEYSLAETSPDDGG